MFAPAAATRNGTAVIVAPGGAFHFLMMNHEGDDVARWLASLGVMAFVLRCRLNRTPESDSEMPAFLGRLFTVLPHPARTDVSPPVANAPTEQARRWAEGDGSGSSHARSTGMGRRR
jgi:hypothetical protein